MNKIIASPEVVALEIDSLFKNLSLKLQEKALEYSRNGDPFHNFNQGAIRKNKDPRIILYGFLLKQLISLDDIIDDLEKLNKEPVESMIDEKIGDIIIYLALLRTMNKVVANETAKDLPF